MLIAPTVPWTTQAELQYLNKIGETSPMTKNIPRRTIIRGYIEAAERRAEWGDMDSELVIKHARGMLTKAVLEGERTP